MAGTLAPSPWFTGLDANGKPYAAGKLYTYAAGTTNNQATYNNADLDPGHANTNPVILDGAGRCVLYLSATSYRFDLYTAAGALVRTQDNIAAVPTSSGNVEVQWTAGEALNANQLAYLSDGSGGKTAGLAYIADSANAYSSTLPEIGMVTNAIALGAVGTVRKIGQMTALAGMTAGAAQYVGTAGALTGVAPSLARRVGQAVSTTVLDLSADPPAAAGGYDFVQLQVFGAWLIAAVLAAVLA